MTNNPGRWYLRPPLTRRSFLKAALLLGTAPVYRNAHSSDIGALRECELVVPFSPGSVPDLLARACADSLSTLGDLRIRVVNRPGAGGNVGASFALENRTRVPTLMLATSSHAINHLLYDHMSYRFHEDFDPLSVLATSSAVLVVHGEHGSLSAQEFIEAARKERGGLTFGSGGLGSLAHIAGMQLQEAAGILMRHVPFRGAPEALVAAIGGHIDCAFATTRTALSYITKGTLRPLLCTSPHRAKEMPFIPTARELFNAAPLIAWYAIVLPSRSSSQLHELLRLQIQHMIGDPLFRDRVATIADEPEFRFGSAARSYIRESSSEWTRLLVALQQRNS